MIAENNILFHLRDYSEVRVFPVSVYPIIFVVRKSNGAKPDTVGYEHLKEQGLQQVIDVSSDLEYGRFLQATWNLATQKGASGLADRLQTAFPSLEEVADVVGAATVAEAYEFAHLLSELGREQSMHDELKFINSGTIDRYENLWGIEKCRYLGKSYLRPVIKKNRQKLLGETRKGQAHSAKIIVAGMTKQLECVLDPNGEIMAGKSTSVIMSSELDLHYLLGILNSRVVSYYYNSVFGGDRLQGGYLRIGPPQLRTIPIPNLKPTHPHSKRVVTLVKDLIAARTSARRGRTSASRAVYENKCSAVEQQIDKLVYEIYQLTPADIAAVDGGTAALTIAANA